MRHLDSPAMLRVRPPPPTEDCAVQTPTAVRGLRVAARDADRADGQHLAVAIDPLALAKLAIVIYRQATEYKL